MIILWIEMMPNQKAMSKVTYSYRVFKMLNTSVKASKQRRQTARRDLRSATSRRPKFRML